MILIMLKSIINLNIIIENNQVNNYIKSFIPNIKKIH